MFDRSPPSPSVGPLQRLLAGVLSLFLVVGGMLLMLGALMLGLVMAAGVVLWALVRGRRPPTANLRWGRRMSRGGFRHPADFVRPRGEVVDVQAREVDEPGAPR